MCGITGIYAASASQSAIKKMNEAIAHRGPDADGSWVEENVGLGHRRLSIIDLSEGANQPMFSHDERYVMVYNGEVYNFKSIAKEISSLKTDFAGWKTTSDTEVIIEAFALWGERFVEKLNGMFAIAIFDRQTKGLYLFRDRMGIKPLFYFYKDGYFAFASELKALLTLDVVKQTSSINKSVIAEFLHLGYISEPNTIYQNIYKFPAASYAVIKEGEIEINKYWDVRLKVEKTLIVDEKQALSELKILLEDAVERCMVSDVPFGCFLSGGIDSSLVTAVAQSVSKEAVNTFSIGFKEAKYNESVYAKEIASFLQTKHHEYIVSVNEGVDLIRDIVDVYDEPYADSSAVPTMMVSKMAKQQVSMVLSGDGGDELFGGYGAYKWAERMYNPFVRYGRKGIAAVLRMGNNRYQRIADVLDVSDYKNIKSHIFSQEQYLFSSKELDGLLNNELINNWKDPEYKDLKRKLLPMEEQSLFDMEYYLKDDLLVKVDRAAMIHSLEVRVPLLDYRLVELALNISPNLKINDMGMKYLLKQLLYQYIPSVYFERPKRGFAIPLAEWMQKELRPLVEEYTSKARICKNGYLRYEEVERLKKEFFSGKTYLYNRIWLIVVLNMWLEKSGL